jgi:undecaprenyl-diphosphatase
VDWLWGFDLEALRFVNQSLHAPWLDVVFWLATGLGLGWVQVLILLGLFARTPTRRAAIACGFALLLGSVILHIIKRIDPRLRPGALAETIVAPDERIYHGSFPSGHTTTAFAVAITLALMAERPKAWWYVGIGLATLVGISRVYRGVHWPTDVIGGAALGAASALVVRAILTPREQA